MPDWKLPGDRRDGLQDKALKLICALARSLDLSREDVGTMLGATGEDVPAWERGARTVPDAVYAKLHSAGNALDRLLSIFRLDRLPQVIRRRAARSKGDARWTGSWTGGSRTSRRSTTPICRT